MYKLLYLLLINFFCILFFVIIGGLLPLLERKYLSLVQRRIGPKFVGFNGRLQFLTDALKVLFKEFVVLKKVNKFFYTLIPIIFLTINLSLISIVFIPKGFYFLEQEFSILYLIFVEIFNIFLILIIGFTTKNKYAVIASSRSLNLYLIADIINLAFFSIVYFQTSSFSFQDLNKYDFNSVFKYMLFFPVIVIIILINTHKSPFDIIEAETEIIMGYHLEYSGFWFGIFVLIEYIHIFIFSFIMALFI